MGALCRRCIGAHLGHRLVLGGLEHWRCTSVDHVFVMLECILDAFEWWFELVECIEGYLS